MDEMESPSVIWRTQLTLGMDVPAILAAVLELFALAGSLIYGALADKYSRRTTFVTACGKHPNVPSVKRPGLIDMLILGFSSCKKNTPFQSFSASGQLCNAARIGLVTLS